jgi:protein involved in polysaccharide export with SLBB domain
MEKKWWLTAAAKLMICQIVLISLPVSAADLNDNGQKIPSIQSVQTSDKSAPLISLDMAMEAPVDAATYIVGPGDQLAVHIIVGDAELSIDHYLLVGADGKVFFPQVGEIYLAGESLNQAKAKLESSVRAAYHERFVLSLLLSQPKKVKIYLTGMIKNPGPIAVYDNSRISEVIAAAGGPVSGASNRYVYIRRGSGADEKTIVADLFEAYRSRDVTKDVRVQVGDIIEVPDANNERISQDKSTADESKLLFEGKETFIYVYGEVNRSGRFEYVPGRRVSDYISYAGGPTAKALLNSVSLTRQEDGKPKKYDLDVSDILYNGNSKNDLEVLGGDVINVPGNFFYFADFSGFVNTVLLGLTLYNTVK